MLWFVCFFNYADRQAIFSVFPKLKEEFGFSKVELGLIWSAFMWVYARARRPPGILEIGCDARMTASPSGSTAATRNRSVARARRSAGAAR